MRLKRHHEEALVQGQVQGYERCAVMGPAHTKGARRECQAPKAYLLHAPSGCLKNSPGVVVEVLAQQPTFRPDNRAKVYCRVGAHRQFHDVSRFA